MPVGIFLCAPVSLDVWGGCGYIVRMVSCKKIIGILGGIGSGKSTVAGVFGVSGCAVVDADAIAHEILDEPETKEQILAEFGEEVFAGGSVDRQGLGDAVFASGDAAERINAIVHPKVLSEIDKLIEIYNRDSNVRAIVLDVPLLLEIGWERKCDSLIFVECNSENRAKRAEKKGLSEENLKKREKFQISLDKKAKLAHYIVHNNSGTKEITNQVTRVLFVIVNE
jgi:dephospho-CoA kinase